MASLPTDKLSDVLLTLYMSVERQLAALVEAAVMRGAVGTAAYLHGQELQVHAIVASFRRQSTGLERAVVSGVYRAATNAVDVVLGRAGEDLVEHAFGGVDQRTVAILAHQLTSRTDAAAITVGRRANDALRQAGLEGTMRGAALAVSHERTTAEVLDALRRQGVTGFVDRAGRRWRLSVYASMVARTTTREAVSRATASRLIASGQDLVDIPSHGETDELCHRFEGTWSLTGATPGYGRLTRYPPFHPNCVHVMTPALAALDEFEAALQEYVAGRGDAPSQLLAYG